LIRPTIRTCLIALSAAPLAGCLPARAPEAGERVLVRGEAPIAARRAPNWAESMTVPPTAAAPSGDPATPSAALESLLDETLMANPALRASWSEFEAALQRIPQVTALSEPQITTAVFLEEVQTRTGPQDFILGLQQRFPWFGVLDLRGQAAWEMAQEKLQRHLGAILGTVRRAQGLWWQIAYQGAAREIALEELTLLEGFSEIAASRYATGVGPQQAVLKAEVEISRVQEQLINIDERISTLTSEVNALRDRSPQTRLDVPPLSAVPLHMFDYDVVALVASAESLRPEIAELSHRLERFERERRLARTKYFPKFMVGANWIGIGSRPDDADPRGEGDDAVNVVLGATIPVWWRAYRAAVTEAERSMAATEDRLRDAENRVASEIHTAHFAMTEALDLMELYATALIPQAEQTLHATEAGFSTGQMSFLDLIDAERVLLRLRLAHERARRDYLLAVADLERSVGAALASTAPTAIDHSQEMNP
jgi:outer membrane protein TolC